MGKNFSDEIWYYPLPILVFVATYLQLILHNTFGVSPDSIDYVKIATDLPEIKDSLFPLFYPLVLKMVNIFFSDYFIASKVVSAICIIFVFAYTYYFKFFWKELWIILCFPTFLDIFYFSWSENLLLPLMVVFAHINWLYFERKPPKYFLPINVLIILLMLMTKYSALGICFGYGLFLLVYSMKYKSIPKSAVLSLIIAAVLFAGYLLLNYSQTGDFFGHRIPPKKTKMNIRYSIFNIIYNLNPVMNDRNIFNFKVNYILLALISISFYFPLLFIRKAFIRNSKTALFFLSCSVVFLLFTFASYFRVNIDNLDPRLLMPYVFFILISITIVVHSALSESKLQRLRKLLLFCIYFSFFLNIGDSIYRLNTIPMEQRTTLDKIKMYR